MRSPATLVALLVLCTVGTGTEALATGALFGRQINSTETVQSMEIHSYDAKISVVDNYAVTRIDQRCFNNLRATVEVTFIFPLPEDAFITYFAYWFNGKKYVATVKERQTAQKTYDSLVSRMIDPALLVDLGNNIFKLNIAPVHAYSELRFEMTYVEVLPQTGGFSDLRFILNTTGLSPKPLQRVSVTVDATAHRAIDSFAVTGHGNTPETSITRLDTNHCRAVFGDENYTPDSDLQIRYRVRHEPFEATVISYRTAAGDSLGPDGYYGLWVTIPDTLENQRCCGRSIVFAADVSSSMMGERLEGLKQALSIFLDGLVPEDRFTIVIFSTGVSSFRPDLVEATASTVEQARMFVSQLGASGLTNIDDALAYSLAMTYSNTTANNLLIFMTDGAPTWGETAPGAIVDNAVARNRNRVRILPFGIGDEISRDLLDELALRNGGYATYITTGAGFAASIRDFFRRALREPMTDIVVDVTGLGSYDRLPGFPSTTEVGTQFVQFGRYGLGGGYPIKVSAVANSNALQWHTMGHFTDTAGGPREIALLWARAKINDLLRNITIYGEEQELIDAVMLLSIRYGILTPYTALYADPNTSTVDGNRLVARRLAIASVAPNPMREAAVVTWLMPQSKDRRASVDVMDMQGRLVRCILDADVDEGLQLTTWDGADDAGHPVPSGTYFLRIRAAREERIVVVVVTRG